MSWITLNENDVKDSLNDDELRLYREKIAEGDSDPLSGILADVTQFVRGVVSTRFPLEAAGIPHSLKNAAVDIAIYRLAKRIQTKSEEQRKPAADAAMDLLKLVANGEFGIGEDPNVAQTGKWGSRPNILEPPHENAAEP